MKNIHIDDGYESFMINDNPDRVIRFNPSDIGIIERIKKTYDNVEKYTREIGQDIELDANGNPVDMLDASANVIAEFRKYICEQIDFVFDGPVSETVFGNQSPLSTVGGVPFYERFLNAISPVVIEAVAKEREASQKRVEKYTKQVK